MIRGRKLTRCSRLTRCSKLARDSGRLATHTRKPVLACLGLTLAVCLLQACTLPDLGHAKQQIAAGNIAPAQAELAQLATKGVVEAMVLLGDQLSKTEPAQAEQYYVYAVAAGEFKARGRLAKLYSQLAAETRQAAKFLGQATGDIPGIEDAHRSLDYARAALALGDDSVLSVMIKLNVQFPELNVQEEIERIIQQAQKTGSTNALYAKVLWWESQVQVDANAAQIERICKRLGHLEVGCYRSLVSLYQVQQDEAKIAAVVDQIKRDFHAGYISGAVVVSQSDWLADKNPVGKGAAFALALLDSIRSKYPDANYEIAQLLYQHPGLQYAVDMDQLLETQQQAGDWRSSELLGEMYFMGKQRPLDPTRVYSLLQPIEDRSVSANYYLGLLARDGLLGQVDSENALQYLLKAARFGHEKADVALAEMFWQARGLAKNPVYAYSFARIASMRGSRQGEKLSTEIAMALNQQQVDQAVGLSNQELQARQLIKKNHLACCELETQGAALQ